MEPEKKKESPPPSKWSDLPIDLLLIICNKIKQDIADYSRFRSVCKSWRLASKQSTRKSEKIPWLLLPYGSSTSTRSFFNPSTRSIYNFDLPEFRDHAIIASSNGWLVLINQNFDISIINPITRARVHHNIPRFNRFSSISGIKTLDQLCMSLKFYISMSQTYPECPHNCILAFAVTSVENILYCRLGEESWHVIECGLSLVQSISYYKGDFCVATFGGFYFGISVSNGEYEKIIVKAFDLERLGLTYFVEWGDDLFLVVHSFDDNGDDDDVGGDETDDEVDEKDTRSIDVYKLVDYACYGDGDCSVGGSDDEYFDYYYLGGMNWLKIDEISGSTIFFSQDMATTVFTDDASCFKGDTICYPSTAGGRVEGVKMFDMVDMSEKVLPCLWNKEFNPPSLKPIWFTPSLS